jgi:purine-binding chemotaxis protein CheW
MAETAGEKGEPVSPAGKETAVSAGEAAPKRTGVLAGKFQVVEFLLGREHYAIDLFDVREVVEYTTITQLPNTPTYMKGIIDLRGEITTIIDLKERLNIAGTSSQPIENSRIIVLDEKLTRAKTGILVDDVLAVSTFERDDIDSTSASGARDDAAILGIIKKRLKEKEQGRNELIIWIDIRHLLADIGEG